MNCALGAATRLTAERLLERNALKRNDELNAVHLFSLKSRVIGDEQINTSASSTCELDGIGGAKRAIATQ